VLLSLFEGGAGELLPKGIGHGLVGGVEAQRLAERPAGVGGHVARREGAAQPKVGLGVLGEQQRHPLGVLQGIPRLAEL
jgi:hypothetical protein